MWDGSREDWYLALVQRFSTIRLRICSEIRWKLGYVLKGLYNFVAAQAAYYMSVVKLFTAWSTSELDSILTLRFTYTFIIFWHWKRLVRGENNLGASVRVSGVPEILRSTEEWSEFKSNILLVEQYKLLGSFVTKISRISGFFLRDEGQ